MLSSSLASGRSFLKVLGVEEEPHLVTVLMEKMSAVKQLQTLHCKNSYVALTDHLLLEICSWW